MRTPQSATAIAAACLGLALLPGAINAAPPDPDQCSVSPCDNLRGVFVSPTVGRRPDPLDLQIVTVTVRDEQGNAIPDAIVEIHFSDDIVICPDAIHSGHTDQSGAVELILRAGGCAQQQDAGVVIANGVVIRSYDNVKSPDYNGIAGDLSVDDLDEAWFLLEWEGSVESDCHDYNNDGEVDFVDFVDFNAAHSKEHRCGTSSLPEGPQRLSNTVISRVTPMPVRDRAEIRLRSETSLPVTLKIYTASGRLVDTIYRGRIEAQKEVIWSPSDSRCVGGAYFLALESGNDILDSRLILLIR